MERDRLILAQLRFLGNEKGKPFKPDERQAKIFEDGVVVGEAMAKANRSDKRVEPPFPAWKTLEACTGRVGRSASA